MTKRSPGGAELGGAEQRRSSGPPGGEKGKSVMLLQPRWSQESQLGGERQLLDGLLEGTFTVPPEQQMLRG